MRLVLISDTHMTHKAMFLPEGDVLIHAGDFTNSGSSAETADALWWFRNQPHKHKICIAGNHDFAFETDSDDCTTILGPDVHYLEGTGVEIEGVKFWGSPVQPEFHDWAFNRSKKYRSTYWDENLPEDTDVLITHCPPRQILDWNYLGEYVGCKHLRRNVIERVKPKLHVFGHIHEARGGDHVNGVDFINATCVDEKLVPRYEPWVVDYDPSGITLVSR